MINPFGDSNPKRYLNVTLLMFLIVAALLTGILLNAINTAPRPVSVSLRWPADVTQWVQAAFVAVFLVFNIAMRPLADFWRIRRSHPNEMWGAAAERNLEIMNVSNPILLLFGMIGLCFTAANVINVTMR